MIYKNNCLYFNNNAYTRSIQVAIDNLAPGTYDTNLLYYIYNTGKLFKVKLLIGVKRGISMLVGKTQIHGVYDNLYFHTDGSVKIGSGNGLMFINSYVDKIIPALRIEYNEIIQKYTKYLNNWEVKREALTTFANDYPEYFI